jgi:hypothetical protein
MLDVIDECHSVITPRRISGSYTCGYSDMNDILRNSNLQRQRRQMALEAQKARIEKISVVCLDKVVAISLPRNANMEYKIRSYRV